jgi:ribosomal protein L24E
VSELHIDHGDLKHGFAIGKAHNLAEWSFRKDEREFANLCNKLYLAKWYRAAKAEGGERWQRIIASHKAARAKRNADRRAKYETPLVCDHCGGGFLPVVRGGRRQRFCTRKCSQAAWWKARPEYSRDRSRLRRAKPPVTITCDGCGCEFVKRRKCHLVCSPKCVHRVRRRREMAARHATDSARQHVAQEHAPA